jgi:hypothetical protein
VKTVEHLQLTVVYLVPSVCVTVALPATFELLRALMLTIMFFCVVMLNARSTVPDISKEPTAFICEVCGVFLGQANTPAPHSPYQMSSHLEPLKDACDVRRNDSEFE